MESVYLVWVGQENTMKYLQYMGIPLLYALVLVLVGSFVVAANDYRVKADIARINDRANTAIIATMAGESAL
jgi:amino acid permease